MPSEPVEREDPRRSSPIPAQLGLNVLTWLSTGGVVLVLRWAFSIAGELRAMSGVPARMSLTEARINALEQELARKDEALAAARHRIDRLESALDGYGRRP